MSDEKGEAPKFEELALRASGNGTREEAPLPGVSRLATPKGYLEVELTLLRQAYQEHGKTLGNVLESIRRLEGCHADVAVKLDQVLEVLSKR